MEGGAARNEGRAAEGRTMRNTILIDPAMKQIQRLSGSLDKLQQASAGTMSFREIQAKIDAAYGGTANAMEKEAADWSLAEYKQYFRDQVDALPVDESRQKDTISIDITDEAFEKMQTDPSYEQWVLGQIAAKLSSKNNTAAYSGGGVSLLHFGAEMKDYRDDSWGRDDLEWMDFFSYNPLYSSDAAKKRQTSFWTKRAQKMTQQMMAQTLLAQQTQQISQMTEHLADLQHLAMLNSQSAGATILSSPLASAAGLTGDFRIKGAELTTAYLTRLMQQNSLLAGL